MLRIGCLVVGLGALVSALGFRRLEPWVRQDLEVVFPALAAALSVLAMLEWKTSRAPGRGLARHVVALTVVGITLLGAVLLGVALPESTLIGLVRAENRGEALQVWWRLTVLVWVGLGVLDLFRQVSFAGWSPAVVLVVSFLGLILVGTLLLMLPFARPPGSESADFGTALFTATSAVCVTGLTVQDTGTYWSRGGQGVILVLIQAGGLGIMTFGAFFSLMVGRGLMVREVVLLGDLLERKVLNDIRRLVIAILTFTLVIEALGAVLLSGLWSHLPPGERAFCSVFHSVSAFCNAGFSLMPNSFEGQAGRWQVWGVLSALIVLGGLGFGVLYNFFRILADRLHRRASPRARLSVTTRLVLITTGLLLAGGAAGVLLLEGPGLLSGKPWAERLADAWFQSVTCRTAGFHTLPVGSMTDGTKFLLILLMYVGASPGSTGGGVKTVAVAVCLLTLRAVLRGRSRVEVFHRTLSDTLVFRAWLIVALGVALIVALTLALVAIESRPGRFLDCLFEASSALGTVGLSTGLTPELGGLGRGLMIVAMFLGRVGPLTLLMALAGRTTAERYRYPEEGVGLG